MTDSISDILAKHRLWLDSEDGGERAGLIYADLSNANLSYAVGNLLHLKTIICDTYPVTYTAEDMQIGCQRHAIKEWWEFDDRRIVEMDGKTALKFWRKWKPLLQQIIEASPAEPTGETAGGES